MAQRRAAELLAGVVVIVAAAGFLGYAVMHTGRASSSGYTLHARFDRIDGLNTGADVRVAGVRVGSVTGAAVDPKTYQAVVDFTVRQDIQLPTDSSAEITTDGLLGGKFIALVPGGAEAMIPPGGQVGITQSSISLEALLGKFIFSSGSGGSGSGAGQGAAGQGGAGQSGAGQGQGGAGQPGATTGGLQ